MERYKVKIYPAAKQDLLDIIDYLNTLSPDVALRYYDLLDRGDRQPISNAGALPTAQRFSVGGKGLPLSGRQKLSCVLCGGRGHGADPSHSIWTQGL